MIILFHPEGKINGNQLEPDYSEGVNAFLSNYYMGQDVMLNQVSDEKLRGILSGKNAIEGRCGYIRQGFPIIVRDYIFNKVSLHIDGVNGKLSDIDYLDAALHTVTRQVGLPKELSGSPAYFKKNKALQMLSNFFAPPK